MQFIDAAAGDEMGLMYRVAVLSGCRRAELCGFRGADTETEKPYRGPKTGRASGSGSGRRTAALAICRPDGTADEGRRERVAVRSWPPPGVFRGLADVFK